MGTAQPTASLVHVLLCDIRSCCRYISGRKIVGQRGSVLADTVEEVVDAAAATKLEIPTRLSEQLNLIAALASS